MCFVGSFVLCWWEKNVVTEKHYNVLKCHYELKPVVKFQRHTLYIELVLRVGGAGTMCTTK